MIDGFTALESVLVVKRGKTVHAVRIGDKDIPLVEPSNLAANVAYRIFVNEAGTEAALEPA